MLTPEQIRAAMAKEYASAQDLMKGFKDDEAIPESVLANVNTHLGKFDELKASLDLVSRFSDAGAQLDQQGQGTQGAHLSWRQSSPNEGMALVDGKSWQEVEIKGFAHDASLGVIVPVTRKIRFHVPLAVQGKKDYPFAFEAYIRKGKERMGASDLKTLTEAADDAGGFLVPGDYHVELIKKIATVATVRANARVAQTSRDIAKWPRVKYTTDDKYTSGVRMTWTGESPSSSTVHRVTDPVFGTYSVPVHTAMASMPISNDLIEDSAFDIIGISQDMIGEAFGLGENSAFWVGSGLGQPQGITSQVDGDGPASVVSGSSSSIVASGVVDTAYALPAQYERNAKWYFAKATEKVIRSLRSDSGAGAGTGDYLWPIVNQGGNFGVAPRELLGFPTIRDEFVPAIAASAYPVIFGDLMGYLVLDRVGLSVQRLGEVYAESNVQVLLARKRVGGQLVEPYRVKAMKIST